MKNSQSLPAASAETQPKLAAACVAFAVRGPRKNTDKQENQPL
jgi:hypothetical protein